MYLKKISLDLEDRRELWMKLNAQNIRTNGGHRWRSVFAL